MMCESCPFQGECDRQKAFETLHDASIPAPSGWSVGECHSKNDQPCAGYDAFVREKLTQLLVETTYALRSGHKVRFPQAETNRKFLRTIGVNIDDQTTVGVGIVVRVPHTG
jgi:hypothetical protein